MIILTVSIVTVSMVTIPSVLTVDYYNTLEVFFQILHTLHPLSEETNL